MTNETIGASASAEGSGGYFGEDAATLGDRIAAARQAAGLTQSALAARLGVGARVISGWENDRAEPRANRLTMLAGLLGVSVAWLLTGVGEGVAPPENSDAAAPKPIRLTLDVADLSAARTHCVDVLGWRARDITDSSATFDAYGHQVTLRPDGDEGRAKQITASFELSWDGWRGAVDRLRTTGAAFLREPSIENVGRPDEFGVLEVFGPGALVVELTARRAAGAA